jgi:hypothetical protein
MNSRISLRHSTNTALPCKRISYLKAVAAVSSMLWTSFGSANPMNFEYQNEINDDSFRKLVRPLITTTRFMFLQPASPTGTTGFDLGVAATGTPVPSEARDVAKASIKEGEDFPDYLAVARLSLQKGLPFDIDLAANAAIIPDTSIVLLGAGLQWTVFNEPFPVPNIALRFGHTQLLGLTTLAAQTTQIETLASLGFPPGINLIKPYAGVGFSWAAAQSKTSFVRETGTQPVEIDAKASWEELYGIFGLQLSLLPLVAVTVEMQKSSAQSVYSAKLSLNF